MGTEDILAVARGLESGGEGRGVEDAHLVLGAATRQHVITVDVEHIELGLRGGHRAFGDELTRGDETLEVDRREGQHVADVVEAVARVVGGEVHREVAVDVAEVADRVIILGAVEPADRHLARVDLGLGDGLLEQAADLSLEGLDLGLGRAGLALRRRHLAGDHLGDHLTPQPLVAVETRGVLEKLQVEVGLRLVVPVAIVAVFLKKRLDAPAEILGREEGAQEPQDREPEQAGPPSPPAAAPGVPHGSS